VKFRRWFALTTRDCATHCGAVCEAVPALPSRATTTLETATKIFSEDRPRTRRLSIVKIASFALDPDRCIARAPEFPDGSDAWFVAAFSNTKTIVSGRSRTRAPSRRCPSVVLRQCELRSTRCQSRTSRAARSDSARSDQTTNISTRSSSRKNETSRDHSARSPSSGRTGRERPPSKRVRGRLPGVAEGVAHAPGSLDTIIRAGSATAQSAAAFSMAATAHRLVRQWFAVAPIVQDAPAAASSIRRPLQRPEGGQLIPDALSPLLSPVSLCEGCDKLTLTVTATRGRAR
jgi:hypothetical protein